MNKPRYNPYLTEGIDEKRFVNNQLSEMLESAFKLKIREELI